MTNSPEVRQAIYEWMADLDSPIDHTQLVKRFWDKTDLSSWDGESCLEWKGSVNSSGYPVFTIKGVAVYGHRIAARIGMDGMSAPRSVPSDLVVDHDRERGCTSKSCVNPLHLDVVTSSVNGKRVRDLNVFT